MKQALPVVIGNATTHTTAQQIQRLRFIEDVGKELVPIAQSPSGAMVAIDHRHAASAGQSHHDARPEGCRKMIGMLPVDVRVLKPTLQRRTVHEMRGMAATKFPRDADVEPERKDLVELLSLVSFSVSEGTARAIVVATERNNRHEGTCETEREQTESPADAEFLCGARCQWRKWRMLELRHE